MTDEPAKARARRPAGTLRSEQPVYAVTTGDLDRLTYADAQAYARGVERAGFGMMWLSEVAGREAFTAAQLALTATEGLRVGSGVARALERVPKNAGAAQATLSEGFPARYVLGLGVSGAVRERGTGPVPFMAEYLDAIDDELDRLNPGVPTRRVLGAYSAGLIRLAADRADGLLTFLVTDEHTRWARSVLGGDPFLSVAQWVVPTHDVGAARAIARHALAYYLTLPHQRRKLQRLGFTDRDLAAPGSDRLVDALVYHGSPDQIAAALRAQLRAGADQVAVSVLGLPSSKASAYRELAAALGLEGSS